MPEIFPESAKDVKTYWERPPPKYRGDSEEDSLFAAVGKALTAWECVEEAVAPLFMTFVQSSAWAVSRAFGATEFNSGRKKALDAAAAIYFSSEDEVVRRSYNRLADHLTFGSDRRNDIAHGMVITFTVTETKDDKMVTDFRGSLLMPPGYNTGRTLPQPDIAETDLIRLYRSMYRFDSADVTAFATKFYELRRRIMRYRIDIERVAGHFRPETLAAFAARREETR